MADVPPSGQVKDVSSVSSFISAVIFNSAVALAFYTAFIVLRRRFPLVYAPRTFLVPAKNRSPPLERWYSWLTLHSRSDDEVIINRIGPDNWAVIFYMRQLFRVFLFIALVGVIILFPTYITGNAGNPGLNKMTIGNVGDDQTARLWGTLFLTWAFIAVVLYIIFKLLNKAAELRHKFLLSPENRASLSGYTLVVRDIPRSLRDPVVLRKLLERIQPNKVLDVILTRDVRELKKLHTKHVGDRDSLEKASTTYIKTVCVNFAKHIASLKKDGQSVDLEDGGVHAIPPEIYNMRPTHKKMMIYGEKVDSISEYIREMRELETQLKEKRSVAYTGSDKFESAAFIIFSDLFAPHVAALANIHGTPGVMDDKQACVDPNDVIWDNLQMPFYQRQIRGLIALLVCVGLVIFWGIITAFLAGIASLDQLTKTFPFLGFFNDLPASVKGIIQGILPTVLVAILFSLLPMILRFLSKFAGEMTNTAVEKTLINQYYGFLVFNVLLIVTISGSVFQAIQTIIDNPPKVFEILARSIPGVSTFFVNYVILLALSGPAGELLQIANLILKPLKLRFLASTPRAIWRQSQPLVYSSGVPMASHSFIATVGVTYMTIAPLVSIMCLMYFGFWYIAYSYQMQYVYTTKNQTGGLYLYAAAKQLFVALYIHELVIAGLFLLKTAWIQAALAFLALAITIAFNRYANMFGKLMVSVPAKAAVDESSNRHLTINTDVAKELTSNQAWREEVEGTNTIHGKESRANLVDSENEAWADHNTVSERDLDKDTPAEKNARTNSSEDTEKYEGPDDHEKQFLHPALRPDPLTVWIPSDSLQVHQKIKEEVESGCEAKVIWEGAVIDLTGKITVTTDVIARGTEP
ncbi:hypothetical protein SpCBS45565_g03155 [Spizellomyces sp. 'palustris']|nr:hypothetical protein SpCBS45565_g03155 [Spizellomyces sp. 'palustris']